MTDNERGPLTAYEVTWTSGHVETIHAHQVMVPMDRAFAFGDEVGVRRVMFHGEIDGRWQLILAAPEEDISIIRHAATEDVPR